MLNETNQNSVSQLNGTNIAIAAQQLRAEVTFKKIRDLLAAKSIDVIVLKGPHLGATVYDSPKDRLYGDLDILVKPEDFAQAAAALLENGFKPFAYDTYTHEIQRDFKHWEFISPWGVMVELHRWLSGHDRYPVDSDGLFQRAEKFHFGAVEALGLATEDLLLHLCLHMGTSYFHVIERKHVTDIGLLLKKREINWPVFLQHVKTAGARAIAYYALLAARLQENATIPADFMQKLCPGRLRRLWLKKYIDPRGFPIYRFPEDPIKKIKRNLLLSLLDRPGQWANFFVRTAVTKFRMVCRIIKGNR
jgi:hypothetical protein